ncbi:MAG: MFS transporter [Bdellovibrionota bacterium]
MKKFEKNTKGIIVALISVVMFMEFLDATIINTAIPSIAKSFQQDPLLLKFSVTSYFLSLAIFIPISGWCADKFGTRKIFLSSVTLFVLASFLCAISTNILELAIFRFLQGMGGAFMNPVSRIIILRIFQPKELVRIQGYIFTPAMLGFVLGPFLGGIIATYLSWSWIFLVNIPVGLTVVYLGFYFIPEQKEKVVKKFNTLGFILAAVSLSCISFSVDMIGHYEYVPKIFVFLAGCIGIILFFTLIFYCLRAHNAIFNFLLFRFKTFRVGLLSNFTMYMVSSSSIFLLPLMFQVQFMYSPMYSGILVLPIFFGYLVFRFLAPRIIPKIGFKVSGTISCILVVVSILLVAQIKLTTSIYYIVCVEFLLGACTILFGSTTGALTYVDVPKNLTSHATALDLTSRQFASGMGVGACAFFINFFRHAFSLELSSPGGSKVFQYTFIFMSLLGLLSLIHILQLGRREGEHALKA